MFGEDLSLSLEDVLLQRPTREKTHQGELGLKMVERQVDNFMDIEPRDYDRLEFC